VAGALTPDMTTCTLSFTGFFHFTEHKCYLKDPSKLKRTNSWSWLLSLLACPHNIHTIQKVKVSPKYCTQEH